MKGRGPCTFLVKGSGVQEIIRGRVYTHIYAHIHIEILVNKFIKKMLCEMKYFCKGDVRNMV